MDMPSEPEKLKLISVDVVYYMDYKTYVTECIELPTFIEADTIERIKQKMPVAVDTYRKLYPALNENALKTEMTRLNLKRQSVGRRLLKWQYQ